MNRLARISSIVLMFVFALTFRFTVFAATGENWQKLSEKVARDGQPAERGDLMFFILEDTNPENKDLDHTSHYLSGIGGLDENQKPSIFGFTAASEVWVTNASGNWQIDQWLFLIDREGHILEGNHYDMQLSKSGTLIDDKNLGASRVEVEAKWGELQAFWESKVR